MTEIMHDTKVGPRTSENVGLKTGSRIPPTESVFQIPFWGHIVAANQDIFTKVGMCEDNGVPQRGLLSKYTYLKNQRWRTAAKSTCYNSATACPISLTFCTMTDEGTPDNVHLR